MRRPGQTALATALVGFMLGSPGFSRDQDQDMSKIRLADRTLSLDLVLGAGPKPENRFRLPYAMAIDREGRIFVTDRGNRRVQIFDSEGQFVRTIGGRKNIGVRLSLPKSVALDGFGNVYIGDRSARGARLVVIDRDGRLVKSLQVPFEASSIGIVQDQLFIGTKETRSSANIYFIGPDGNVARKIEECSPESAFWETRVNAACAADGRIFLASEFLPAVRVYAPSGSLEMEFRYAPLTKNYARPDPWMAGGIVDEGVHRVLCYDVAVDSEGSIYLLVSADWKANELCRLYRFDPLGDFQEAVDLGFPCGNLEIDDAGRFYFLSQMATGCLYRFTPARGDQR